MADQPTKRKRKRGLVHRANLFIDWLERKKILTRTPAFDPEYAKEYPTLKYLEEVYPKIKEECLMLLNDKDSLHDVEKMVGQYTQGGIHSIKWKSFMLKSGDFIRPNCEKCPETYNALRKVKGARNVFFSILDSNQYISPHTGYFKGFMRYHLGIVIPHNNEDNKCWIRINGDRVEYIGGKNKKAKNIAKGEKYHWKNGEGILFNDNYLHDAANESDQIRVVLFADIIRKFPAPLNWMVKFALWIAYKTPALKAVAKNAEVKLA